MEKNFKYILNEINTLNFHESIFNNIKLPDNIIDLPNIIIYGNQNIGKYYFALNLIKKYSNNNLNIQRRVEIIINKESEYFKCSDIHYEIDFYLLGTSAKNIWLTFFNHIQNILINKENKTCILLDDIAYSAGTLCNAAKALKNKGAKEIFSYIAHGVLSGKAMERIQNSAIEELVLTDSIQASDLIKNIKNIRHISIAPLMGEAIKRISSDSSVSALFD